MENKEKKEKRKKKKRKGRKKIKREGKIKNSVWEKKKRNNTSLRDLQLTSGRNSSEQEAKLVYVIRPTRGYRNSNFSSKFQEVGVFSYTGSSLFKSRKWSCGLAQTRD